MSGIPLHLQRRSEQRWAAKLASSGASAAPKSIDLKGTVNSLARPAIAKEKPAGAKRRVPGDGHLADL
jgi:hypothetical protein